MKNFNFSSKIWAEFLDIVFPIECIFCGKNMENLPNKERWICPSCFNKINLRSQQVCPICEKVSSGGEVHDSCKKYNSLDGVWVCAYYDEFIEKAIHHFKFKFIKDLSFLLSRIMISSINSADDFGEFHNVLMNSLGKEVEENIYISNKKSFENKTVLIPVPLHKRRYNWRGFNQSELLALELSDVFKIKNDFLGLKKIKNTKPQSSLSDKMSREHNIKNAFSCKNEDYFKDKSVIIVDDLCTTLSTINECSLELKRCGAKKVWGLVLARR